MKEPAGHAGTKVAVVIDNQKSGQGKAEAPDAAGAIDFPFLAAQTFDDAALEREVLGLFVTQVRKVLPKLPGMTAREQADSAHLLKGSARGIGAWAAAAAAENYEAANPDARHLAFPALARAFAAADQAIDERLAAPDATSRPG